MTVAANTVLANRYRIIERLGGGGMGEVYRGEDHVLQREVAVKVLTEGSDEVNRRFLLEAQSMARLNHPNIVAVYDVGVDREFSYIVLEYVRGRTLREIDRTALGVAGSIDLMIQLFEALAYAHDRDVVHRDLKPSNAIVDGDGMLKVMDFGLARRLSGVANLEQSGEIFGTLAYLPPERFLGKSGDRASDLYAAGVLFYELLCGAAPFAAGGTDLAEVMRVRLGTPPIAPAKVDSRIPADLSRLVMRLLAIDPSLRPHGAGAVLKTLRAMRPPSGATHAPARASAEKSPYARAADALARMQQGRLAGLAGRLRHASAHYRAALSMAGAAGAPAEDRPPGRAKHRRR